MSVVNLQKLFDELKPALAGEELPTFDADRHRRSMQLLAMIDELDRLVAAQTTDKASRRRYLQARSAAAQEFAKHLDADTSRFPSDVIVADDHRNVWVVQEVTGSPSRAGRQQADEWTASRNQPWNGDIRKLRASMRQALRKGETLPAGHFGLHVVRTVRIGQWSNDDAREFENAQPWHDLDDNLSN